MNRKQKKRQIKKAQQHQEEQKDKPKGVIIRATAASSNSKGQR